MKYWLLSLLGLTWWGIAVSCAGYIFGCSPLTSMIVGGLITAILEVLNFYRKDGGESEEK